MTPVLRRRLALAGLVLAAVAGLVYAFRPEPVPVDLATVSRGALEVTISEEGVTQIRETYRVSAPITGTTIRSPVEVGDPVEAGTTIVAAIRPAEPAFLDARARLQAEAAVVEAEAALRAAEFNIARQRSDLEYAQSQFERAETLADRGTIPQRMLDDAVLALNTREAALRAAESERDMQAASLERMRAMLVGPDPEAGGESDGESCCVEIHAPVDGAVLSIENRSARLVQAGEPLLEIGRADDLELEVELLSQDAVRISPGAPAYVERWGGETVLEASVRRIEPSAFTEVSALGIEEQRVRVQLDFDSPPGDRPSLGNGFRVFVRIVEWHDADVLKVPVAALFREGRDWRAFRVRDGRAEAVPVSIGRRNGEEAELLDGLSEGDAVIVYPSDRVREGVPILDRATL